MACSLITIAADRYSDQAYMGDRLRLRFAVQGASGLANALGVILAVESHIDLHNELVSRSALQKTFGQLRRENDDDSSDVIVLISGHGDSNVEQAWFCTYDAIAGKVDITGAILGDLILSSNPKTVVVIMDFCHSGGVAKELVQRLRLKLDAKNISVLAGTAGAQLAYEHPAIGLGLFTYSIHEALTERSFYALQAKSHLPSSNTSSPVGELARMFVFARERTEELAYLYAGGKRQTPEIYGDAPVSLTWSQYAIPPPKAPISRRALAGRLRRTLGWSGVAALITACVLYFQMYHLAVAPEGWLELRQGPSWMDSLLPKILGGNDQLSISTAQLESPKSNWSPDRIAQRVSLIGGSVDGLRNNLIEGLEPWIADLSRELSPDEKRSLDYTLGHINSEESCVNGKNQQTESLNFQLLLEEFLLDRMRACDIRLVLAQGIDVSSLYSVVNPEKYYEFNLFNLPDQTVQNYFAGLSVVYRNSEELSDRVRVLEDAAILVAYRSKNGRPRDADWLSFMAFIENVSDVPPLSRTIAGELLPRLAHCSQTWCEMEWRIAAYFAYGSNTAAAKNGSALMMWLIGRHSDSMSKEGDRANSWAIPALLVLARAGHLNSQDFDVMIRYFRWIVPNKEQVLMDVSWLPAFARELIFPQSWKQGLWQCMLGQESSNCSEFDSNQAADILGAQSKFLTSEERSNLVSRIDGRMQQDKDIPLFASSLADLICSSKVPQRWITALSDAISYDIRIAPPNEFDPITGTMVITVTDSPVAVALAVALLTSENPTELRDFIIRYAANHGSWKDMDPLRRSLAQSLKPLSVAVSDQDVEEIQNMLMKFRNNAQARSIILEALAANNIRGLLTHPLFETGQSIWRLDATLAVRRKIAAFGFDSNGVCK